MLSPHTQPLPSLPMAIEWARPADTMREVKAESVAGTVVLVPHAGLPSSPSLLSPQADTTPLALFAMTWPIPAAKTAISPSPLGVPASYPVLGFVVPLPSWPAPHRPFTRSVPSDI